jgi:hypothetical protein
MVKEKRFRVPKVERMRGFLTGAFADVPPSIGPVRVEFSVLGESDPGYWDMLVVVRDMAPGFKDFGIGPFI